MQPELFGSCSTVLLHPFFHHRISQHSYFLYLNFHDVPMVDSANPAGSARCDNVARQEGKVF
jgi:hypothetical protein